MTDRKPESVLLNEIAQAYEVIEKNIYELVYYKDLDFDERKHKAECAMRITRYKCKADMARKKEQSGTKKEE